MPPTAPAFNAQGPPPACALDRTADFRAAVERAARAAQASTSAPANGGAATATAPPTTTTVTPQAANLAAASAAAGGQSEFARRAAAIGAGIHATSGRLASLATLARRTATFDDPAAEVAEVSARVKRDIHSLNAALAELQGLSAAQPAAAAQVVPSAGSSAHAAAHSRAVVDSLRGRLKDATSEFRDVLGARQAALAAHAGRRELFSAPPPAAGGGGAGAPTTARPAATSPPPAGSTSPNVLTHRGHGASPAAAPAPPSARPLFGGATAGAAAGRTPLFAGRGAPGAAASAGNSSETCVPTIQQQQQQQQQPLRQRRVPGAFGGDGSHPFLPPPPGSAAHHQAQQQQMMHQAQAPDAYLTARAGALAQVESTIAELGGIFQQLATLVADQGEVAVRIDEHVSEALGHVDGAQAQLLRHLATISSNRWLVLKCLGVLLAFALFFIFVIA